MRLGSAGIGMQSAEEAAKVRRFFTGSEEEEEDTIGFFIAKFKKRA